MCHASPHALLAALSRLDEALDARANLVLAIATFLPLPEQGPERAEFTSLEEFAQLKQAEGCLLLAVRFGRSRGTLVFLIVVVVRVGGGRGKSGPDDERVGEEGPGEGKVGREGGVDEREEQDREGCRRREDGRVELAARAGQDRSVTRVPSCRPVESVDSLELEEGEVGEEVVLVVGELLLQVVLEQVHVYEGV